MQRPGLRPWIMHGRLGGEEAEGAEVTRSDLSRPLGEVLDYRNEQGWATEKERIIILA